MTDSNKSKLYFGIALVAILLFSLFLILQIALLQTTLRVVVNAVARISFLSIKAPPAAQQNVLDTSTWKTYRNEQYGFEIKYPPNFEVRDLTSENVQYVKNLLLLVGVCDIRFTISCRGTTIHVYNGEFREPSISVDTEVKRFTKGDITFWLGGDNDILSTFKFIKSKSTTLLQVCPDEWIQNDMPPTLKSEKDRQYYILNGERRELSEFDSDWVNKNCNLEKQIVY